MMLDMAGTAVGALIRDLRESLGLSQGGLADELNKVSGHPTVNRELVSRWERGKRTPGPFWLEHLSTVLRVPLSVLENEVRRRTFLGGLAALPFAVPEDADNICSSIAGGDSGPLSVVQTSHQTDLLIASKVGREKTMAYRLARWLEDGSDILRVNAAGVIAKTRTDLTDQAPLALARDAAVRERYLKAFVGRVGREPSELMRELINPRDAGARWCSAYLLRSHPAATPALTKALRAEPVRENVRTIGLILNGEDPTCM